MSQTEQWFIVKQKNGQCAIAPVSSADQPNDNSDVIEQWGPFASQSEAIARRVGLIRAGKCQPV